MVLTLTMGGLALLAAICCVVTTMRNEKHNKERNAALIQHTKDLEKRLADRLEPLEKGIVPDYEQAKAAAVAVNDFNRGIANILEFDPMAALRTDRQKKEMGDVE